MTSLEWVPWAENRQPAVLFFSLSIFIFHFFSLLSLLFPPFPSFLLYFFSSLLPSSFFTFIDHQPNSSLNNTTTSIMSKDTINDTETATAVPEGQKDSLSSFVATLASFSGDLSSLTCPSFLLSSVSLLEYRCVSPFRFLLSSSPQSPWMDTFACLLAFQLMAIKALLTAGCLWNPLSTVFWTTGERKKNEQHDQLLIGRI